MFGSVGKVGLQSAGSVGTGFHPVLDFSFFGPTLDSRLTFTRASIATDGLYTDAAGSGYNTYSSGVPRLTSRGLLLEGAVLQRLLNTDAPATQTTGSQPVASYTLWVIGTGSAIASAGTAVITGAAAVTAGSPNTFSVTTAGTITITVSGTLTRFQLEQGTAPTSYIPAGGTAVTRQADSCTMATSSWFNASAGTLWAEASVGIISSQPVIARFDDGTANNILGLCQINNAAHPYSAVITSGTSTNNFMATTVSIGQTFRMAGEYDATGELTGALGTLSNKVALPAGGLPVVNTLRISGTHIQSQSVNSFVRRVRYYSRVLSNAELIAVTT